jgi:hypothetical protein
MKHMPRVAANFAPTSAPIMFADTGAATIGANVPLSPMFTNATTSTFDASRRLLPVFTKRRPAAIFAQMFLAPMFAFVFLNSCFSTVSAFQARFVANVQTADFETARVEFLFAARALEDLAEFVDLFGFGCGGHFVFLFLFISVGVFLIDQQEGRACA